MDDRPSLITENAWADTHEPPPGHEANAFLAFVALAAVFTFVMALVVS